MVEPGDELPHAPNPAPSSSHSNRARSDATDENPNVAAKMGIRSIPSLFLFNGGQVKSQKVGAAPKGELVKWISGSI
mgnify:CR=1 FL=1